MKTLNSNDDWKTDKHALAGRCRLRPALMVTQRRINLGCREAFDRALGELVAFAVRFPGHLDVHILYKVQGSTYEFAIAHRFVDSTARSNFTSTQEYFWWLRQIRVLTHGSWEPAPEKTKNFGQPHCAPEVSRARVKAIAGGLMLFIAMAAAMGLTPAIYILLANWHPFERLVATAILLPPILVWLLIQGFFGRRNAVKWELGRLEVN